MPAFPYHGGLVFIPMIFSSSPLETLSSLASHTPTNFSNTQRTFSRIGNSFKAFGSSLKAQTEKLQQEASTRFQTPSSTPHSDGSQNAASSSDPADVPKEELVALCVKMSKKVKSLQQTKKELTAALQNQNHVQSELLSFFTTEVVMDVDMTNHGDITSDPPTGYGPRVANVGVLKNAWRETDEKR